MAMAMRCPPIFTGKTQPHEIGLQIHQGECPRKEKTHPQFGDLVNIALNGERISERNDNNKI